MLFYHVDRDLTITDNTIELQKIINPIVFPEFKEGISQHGVHYLSHDFLQKDQYSSYVWEFALEYVRKNHFPKMPSRFQVLFASKNLEDAIQWAKFNSDSTKNCVGIAQIESNNFYKFDYSWLSSKRIEYLCPDTHVTSFAAFCQNCMRYWNQEFSESPTVEYLLPLPCQIQDYTLLYL